MITVFDTWLFHYSFCKLRSTQWEVNVLFREQAVSLFVTPMLRRDEDELRFVMRLLIPPVDVALFCVLKNTLDSNGH
jgi:hypothetical protein